MRILSLLLLLAIVCSCETSHFTKQLDEAEIAMDLYPDSALIMLDSMGDVNAGSTQDIARYALLYSQALDKNYIDVTDDSLINIAIRYYENSESAFNSMKSYFYLGRVKFNQKNYTQALCAFMNSLEIAQMLSNDFWCGKNCEQIADIYATTYYGSDELVYAQKAYDYYTKSENETFSNYALLGLARAHLNSESYNEAIRLAYKADSIAFVNNDSLLSSYSRQIIAKCLLVEKRYKEGLDIIAQTPPNSDEGLDYIEQILRIRSNQTVEAPKGSIENNCSAPFLTYVYEYYKNKKDYQSALVAHERLLSLNDSVITEALNQSFNQGITDYFEMKHQLTESHNKYTRTLHIIIIAILVLTIVIIGLIAFRVHRSQKEAINKNMMIAANLQEILSVSESKYLESRDFINELMQQRFDVIDNLSRMYYENQASKVVRKKIVEEVDKIILDFSCNGCKVGELENIANKHSSNLLRDLKIDFPNLKQADYLLFLYSLLGFSLSAISLFLQVDKIEVVYNRKARLKNKIRQSQSERKSEYLNVLAK